MQRCRGLTRTFRRCGRMGEWKLFCDDHRLQPFGALFVLVFTICAGGASIYSAWFTKPVNTLALRPRVHIQKFELLRHKDTNAAGVSVFFKIENSRVSKLRSIYRIVVAKFPGDTKRSQFEDSLFSGMLSTQKVPLGAAFFWRKSSGCECVAHQKQCTRSVYSEPSGPSPIWSVFENQTVTFIRLGGIGH
jgi:hypothetical protein